MNMALLAECRTSADPAINIALLAECRLGETEYKHGTLSGVHKVTSRRRRSLAVESPSFRIEWAVNQAQRYQAF